MPRSSYRYLPRGRRESLHLRAGRSGSHRDWTSRQLVEILGPDAATAASLSGRRRNEYITARAWLREIVRGRLGLPWHGFEVVPRGEKPRLRRSSLDVSIAHSDDHLLVGVSAHGLLGVDLELVAPVFDQPALARRACSPAELEALSRLPASARRERLAQLWTIKESYAKALGTGLAMDFTAFEAADLQRRSDVRRILTPRGRDRRLLQAVAWIDGV